MKNTHRSLTTILVIILIVLSLVGIMLLDAFNQAPKRYSTRYVTLSSEKISEQLDGMNILFFSDLEYGTFMDQERLNTLIDKINALAPDVVLFGGDLYDSGVTPTDETNQIIANAFDSITAGYGKFAVMGDNDDTSDEMKAAVSSIYSNSNFEVLNNTSLPIHKGGSSSFTLVGLDNGLNGTQDITTAYTNVSNNNYVITLCHTPDTADEVPSDITNYFLAGHSHGGQAYFFFGSLYAPEKAVSYLRGTHKINGAFTLDITNGVGTTIKDVRFMANAEIVVYQLKHEEIKETATPTPSASSDTEQTPTPETTESTEQQAIDEAQAQSEGNE